MNVEEKILGTVPSCYDDPNASFGGECPHASCDHHCVDEPICCAPKKEVGEDND